MRHETKNEIDTDASAAADAAAAAASAAAFANFLIDTQSIPVAPKLVFLLGATEV